MKLLKKFALLALALMLALPCVYAEDQVTEYAPIGPWLDSRKQPAPAPYLPNPDC